MNTQTVEIEILDYDTNIQGRRQDIAAVGERSRWQWQYPFWMTYGVGEEDMARPWNGDFTEIVYFAFQKGWISDFSVETREGKVIYDGDIEMRWSPRNDDWIEYQTGRKELTFSQFCRELRDEQLEEFIRSKI